MQLHLQTANGYEPFIPQPVLRHAATMSTVTYISILLIQLVRIHCHFLEDQTNYQKPKLERNNIVNKRVWMKSNFRGDSYEKTKIGDFIFRANSLDVDNILQNNFDAFGEDGTHDAPVVSSYVKRAKRSNNNLRKQRSIKSLKNCKENNCNEPLQSLDDDSSSVKSKIFNELKPASVFNDYPYEVAILLNNVKQVYTDVKNETQNLPEYVTEKDIRLARLGGGTTVRPGLQETPVEIEQFNSTDKMLNPKRSMKYDFESETIKKFEYTDDANNTEKPESKSDRNVFDKEDQAWHQTAPIKDIYKVVPKEPQKSRPVTERGLLKVISMLTKTFKKIMRQHNEIKDIHVKIQDISDDFTKNAEDIKKKFEEFDVKYIYFMKFNEKLKNFEQKLTAKEEYFKTKEREMANSLNEFENQQRKFLTQQRQFYSIQKLMLAQNEKINIKQNLIAKTQSEISHRQNNFARILKKAKQLYIESKNYSTTKLNVPKVKTKEFVTTSTAAPITENIKINLFSIPVLNKLKNHDDLIMKEKNEPIDDLIYKYYFNNTFIDNLMKSKILTGVIASPDNNEVRHATKSKRDEVTTILLPVNDNLMKLDRSRRWINHHSKHKNKRKNRGKGNQATIINATDEKLIRNNHIASGVTAPTKDVKKNPFVTMAVNFCSELQSNMDRQKLDWCVEKALRRLQYIDVSLFPSQSQKEESLNLAIPVPTAAPKKGPQITNNRIQSFIKPLAIDPGMIMTTRSDNAVTGNIATTKNDGVTTEIISTAGVTGLPAVTSNAIYSLSPSTVHQETVVFFPDNEELESNLKQYDIKPDVEGNVYYEGSFHASEIDDKDSEFIGDFMPGLDSNSRVEVDPLAFDVQAKRRAYIRQLNERIKKQLG